MLCCVAMLAVGVVIIEHADEGKFYFIDEDARKTTGISLTAIGAGLFLILGYFIYNGRAQFNYYIRPRRTGIWQTQPGYHDIIGTRKNRRNGFYPKVKSTYHTY